MSELSTMLLQTMEDLQACQMTMLHAGRKSGRLDVMGAVEKILTIAVERGWDAKMVVQGVKAVCDDLRARDE